MKNLRTTIAAISAVYQDGKWYIGHGSAETEVSAMTPAEAKFYMQVFQPVYSPSPDLMLALVRAANPSTQVSTTSLPKEQASQLVIDAKENIRLHKGAESPKGKSYYASACSEYVAVRFGKHVEPNGKMTHRVMWGLVPIEYLYDVHTGLFVLLMLSDNTEVAHRLYYFTHTDAKEGMMDVYVRAHLDDVGWGAPHSFYGNKDLSEETVQMLTSADLL